MTDRYEYSDPVLRLANAEPLPAKMTSTELTELRESIRLEDELPVLLPGGFWLAADKIEWTPAGPAKAQSELVALLRYLIEHEVTADLCRALSRTVKGIPSTGRVEFWPLDDDDNSIPSDHVARELSKKPNRIEDLLSSEKQPKPSTMTYGFQLLGALKPKSLQQWYAAWIASLISNGLGDRIRQCPLDECNNFFIRWPTKGGRMRDYCCKKHQQRDGKRRTRQRNRVGEPATYKVK